MHRNRGLVFLCIWLVGYVRSEDSAALDLLKPSTRCTYGVAYEMYGAHCAGRRLDHVPSLKTNIEILEFSDNRLRELHKQTFADYTSIKYLYLSENQIYSIDEDAFAPLAFLETVDLSKNVLIELPTSIFNLRYLRKLYLNGNPLIHLDSGIVGFSKAIVAPLELLDLADCKIRQLPNWGLLPQLISYNISYNPLTVLDRDHFVGMCNLKTLDITDSIEKVEVCKLKSTVLWLQDKQVYFMLGNYSKLNSRDFDNCDVQPITPQLNSTHHKCKSEFLHVRNMRASRRTWLTIGGGLAGFLVGFILLLYVMHRRNVVASKAVEKSTNRAENKGKRVLLEYVA